MLGTKRDEKGNRNQKQGVWENRNDTNNGLTNDQGLNKKITSDWKRTRARTRTQIGGKNMLVLELS